MYIKVVVGIVSIPPRYSKIGKTRQFFLLLPLVSIPPRYSKIYIGMSDLPDFTKFQSLLGILKSCLQYSANVPQNKFQSLLGILKSCPLSFRPMPHQWFQSLLGILKSDPRAQEKPLPVLFQSLLGILKSWNMPRQLNQYKGVSIPPRYSKISIYPIQGFGRHGRFQSLLGILKSRS